MSILSDRSPIHHAQHSRAGSGGLPASTDGAGATRSSRAEASLRIAFAVHDYNGYFGHSRYVTELATRFADRHEVHVFANRFDGRPDPRIVFHRIPAIRANALTTVLSFLVTGSWAVRHGFDIVHSQGMCVFGGDVVTAHQVTRAWYLARREADRLSWREHVFGLLVSALEGRFYRNQKVSGIVAISDLVRRDLQRCYGCGGEVPVIHHGTDLAVFARGKRSSYRTQIRQSLDIPDEAVVFLFVGDLRKGAVQSVEALARVPSARLICVSFASGKDIIRHARSHGVADRVLCLPGTNVIERYYAAADAFLLPTPRDAFGLVVTEAMASGLPVVVSRAAGASEIVEHCLSGFLLDDPSDITELASYMGILARDSAVRARMAEAASEAMTGRTWDHVARQVLMVYQDALRGRSAS